MHSLLLATQGARVWLAQRPASGVWAGLWSLPEFADDAALQARIASGAGILGELQPLQPVRHVLTHFDWQLQPWHWRVPAKARSRADETLSPGRWFHRDEALAAGLPAPVRRLIEAWQP
jgi:A/G-specific adenine glycosylase